MGWKNVKEHYGITHMVCVTDAGICIGSPYVHDLIVIAETSKPRDWRDAVDRKPTKIDDRLMVWRPTYVGRGEPFDGIVKAMVDDPATLARLIDTADTFARSLPVWTSDYDGNIIEKQCEEYGWPNVTHDGCLMYENTFFQTRAEAMGAGLKRAVAAAKATRIKPPKSKPVTITVMLPAGVKIKEVVGIRPDGHWQLLEIVD